MFVSPETLRAANSGRERETEKDSDTKLKNAKSRNEIPNWLTTFRDSVGSTDYNNSIGSNTDEEGFKQASSNSNSTSMPNWLITYRHTVG